MVALAAKQARFERRWAEIGIDIRELGGLDSANFSFSNAKSPSHVLLNQSARLNLSASQHTASSLLDSGFMASFIETHHARPNKEVAWKVHAIRITRDGGADHHQSIYHPCRCSLGQTRRYWSVASDALSAGLLVLVCSLYGHLRRDQRYQGSWHSFHDHWPRATFPALCISSLPFDPVILCA